MTEISQKLKQVLDEIWQVVMGQEELKQDILIALLSSGHILLEWVPWLAKTLTVSSFAHTLWLDFQRIQFTPDLLPSDIIWARIYNPESREYEIKKWPIFSNIILADEINRAPSKVQSALLEAMQEKQVTIGDTTITLPSPFIVLATQNPLEQEGTFPLPEAQLDRFTIQTILNYPSQEEELQILKTESSRKSYKLKKILTKKDIHEAIEKIASQEISETAYQYICNIVRATRDTKIAPHMMIGASPRASLALAECSKVLSFLKWRNFVLPEDIKSLAPRILRHRIILHYEALADGITSDMAIQELLEHIKV